MKRIIKYFALSCIAIGAVSCNDVFDDLAVNPQQPSMDSYFTTPEAVNEAVMTCYGYVQTQRSFGASASKTMIIRSDEASSNSDYGKPGMYGSSLNSSYYTIMQPFGLLYSTASQATYVIENIDKVEFFDQELKKAYLGEAYFWRAFANFYLLTNYRNVSLIEHAPAGMEDYVRPVTAPELVWDAIASDLELAKKNLPNKGYWKGENLGRVTAGAAAALRGKAYLFRSGIEPLYGTDTRTFYSEAAAEFDQIIKGDFGSYSLVEYSHNFDVAHENNNESVLELQFLGDVENANFNPGSATSGLAFDTRGIMLPGTGVGYEGVVHDWLYNAFANSIDKDGYTDIRMFSTMFFNDLAPEIKLRPGQRLTGPGGFHFEDMYPNGDFTSAGNTRTHVYKAAFLKGMDLSMPMRNNDPTSITGVGAGVKEYIYNQPRAHGVNWRYIRYADVLLMYAEAVVNGGTQGSISAADAFNQVRTRANMSTVGGVTLDLIKNERALELALEGHRFYDLLRWGDLNNRFKELERTDPNFKKLISATDYEGFTQNKHEWLPIPIEEIESNPHAVQNPGY
ncbi:RagB/SusD family nutrient uptake outer membrane protein [uncultured Duncaniella sp.]|uniref:RagB/SusD family nutrient uptake outer membrane protein n=3 Tax=uncultured Duncaniella sp. TaxID=2768039 RepID=UPI0032201175